MSRGREHDGSRLLRDKRSLRNDVSSGSFARLAGLRRTRFANTGSEFAEWKENITVRQLLSHQAGLFALDQPLNRTLVADLDQLRVLARQKPVGAWHTAGLSRDYT